jgi:glycosyltransferase involved in cell wall biosynthesis/4-hydroxybenzoate polyprenyltransferase
MPERPLGCILSGALRQVRIRDWWDYKIPPLLAVGYGSMLAIQAPPGRALAMAGALVASIAFVAAYGYLINDCFDIEDDRRAGKPNAMADKRPWVRFCLCLAAAAASFVPVVWVHANSLLFGLLILNLLLPTLYSVPPVRLKTRGLWGAVADAGAARAVPTASMIIGAALPLGVPAALLTGAIGSAFLSGFRGIVTHQVLDYAADSTANAATFVRRLGAGGARKLVLFGIFPCEIAFLCLFLAAVLPYAPVAAAATALWLGIEFLKCLRGWRISLFDPSERSRERYIPLVNNEYYEVWLPLALAAQLAFVRPEYTLLAVFQAAAFFPNLRARVFAFAPLFAFRRYGGEGRHPEVIVGASSWTVNGVNVFSANLVRGLRAAGIEAHVLLTEEGSDLVSLDERALPRPSDIPFVTLPVQTWAGWGAHWGAMVRYLEEHAPCVYILNSDYRHSCIAPLLSKRVVMVGIVHSDDPLHYDHVRRLGKYWDRIVAVSHAVREKTLLECPGLAARTTTIPIGVDVPPLFRQRDTAQGRPLRAIYHGILKQQQKRVLDLPLIVSAALSMGIPLELSIAGSGPDEERLREAARPLVERGAIRFLGVVDHDLLGSVLDAHDVFILPSEFEGMPNALIEAMAHGCVPVVSQMTSGVPELVRHGESGYLARMGDPSSFASSLGELWRDSAKLRVMAKAAYETVAAGKCNAAAMVGSYIQVFETALRDSREGRFVRPAGLFEPPPATVAGIGILPVPVTHTEPGLGRFPVETDAYDYRYYRDHPPRARGNRSALDGVTVVVASPLWTRNGVNVFAEDLVRGLQGEGVSSRLLLTEENTPLVRVDEPRLPRPADIPIDELAVTGPDNWGRHWGAMQRYLREHAPCIYVPNYDWRHSCVVPRLDDDVCVVGLVHRADPLYFDCVERLGESLNAIVATSPEICAALRARFPALDGKLETIPPGLDVPGGVRPKDRPEGELRVLVAELNSGVRRPVFHPDLLRALAGASGGSVRFTLVGDVAPWGDLNRFGTNVPKPSRSGWMQLFEVHDVVLTSAPDVLGGQLLEEAMARCCVPVLTGCEAAASTLDGAGCISVPGTDTHAIPDLLARLARDGEFLDRASSSAYRHATRRRRRAKDMVADYIDLFARVRTEVAQGAFRRRRAPLLPPPAMVEEVSVFPVELRHVVDGIGAFPSREDFAAYLEEMELKPVLR